VALTTKIIDGDLLMLRIMFPDGMMATVTAGRTSESITVAPNDREIAERLSSIFHWSADKVGDRAIRLPASIRSSTGWRRWPGPR
jgi:hypothetical protein